MSSVPLTSPQRMLSEASMDLPPLLPLTGEEPALYQPVPPQESVIVAVRYRIVGRGRPLPYPDDDGTGE
jgi:hypothetical protein